MKRIAYYTCFFGGQENYSRFVTPVPSETDDCYYFTNDPNIYNILQHTKYIRIFVDKIPVENDLIKDCMNTKELRTCPHHFDVLKGYEYICWFDSKLVVSDEKVKEVLSILDRRPEIWAMTKHPYSDRFGSVWDEYNLAIGTDKYFLQKDRYKAYIEKQIQNGFSEKQDIQFCGGFTIKKNCAMANVMGETWLRHIQECGIEDQISFNFVRQLYSKNILALEYQHAWKYYAE